MFDGRFELLRRAYKDTYSDITQADNRARAVVEEGGAIEAVVYEELGKDIRVRKVTYQRENSGGIKRTTNV